MPLFRRPRLFTPVGDDQFAVALDADARRWLVELADQLDQLLSVDTDVTRRLFPTAYPDDPERDAGYQVLARDQLIDSRRDAIELMRRTIETDTMTAEELSAWMGIVNDLRLVLGTRLDVSEDDDGLDPDDPSYDEHLVYHELGAVLSEIVDAMTATLPPPED